MNQELLQQKLDTLAFFPDIRAGTVQRFGQILTSVDDWDLFRINPFLFAEQHGFAVAETVDLFVHAAKIGLLDFAWNMLCPSCGCVAYSHSTVNEVPVEQFHCTVCSIDVPSNLDDHVEVAFTLNPSVRKLGVDPFQDLASYRRYFYSPNFEFPPALLEYVAQAMRAFILVRPDETQQVVLETEPGQLYVLICLDRHSTMFLHVAEQEDRHAQTIEIDSLAQGFAREQVTFPPGQITLRLHNLGKSPTGAMLIQRDWARLKGILEQSPPRQHPFLTGKMLLNNQSFRDLFRVQELNPDLKLNIRSLTVLFTDLKDSTELYDVTGDAFAYNLIQEHFRILMDNVRGHNGAIVKTMGDAIMASFSTPQDGVNAAVGMLRGMQSFNQGLRSSGYELSLKVGLHEGTALAVNADDRLDYFGQTINIAARVQGLAGPEEIWVTEPVFHSSGVQNIFVSLGYHEQKQSVTLKGVREATTVYQMCC